MTYTYKTLQEFKEKFVNDRENSIRIFREYRKEISFLEPPTKRMINIFSYNKLKKIKSD